MWDEFLKTEKHFVKNKSINKNLSHISHSYHGLRFSNGFLKPVFQEFAKIIFFLFLEKTLNQLESHLINSAWGQILYPWLFDLERYIYE